MKKIAMILFIICIMLVGCNTVDDLGSTTNEADKITDVFPNTNTITNYESEDSNVGMTNDPEIGDLMSSVGGQKATAVDGIHHEMYYAIETSFIEHFIGLDEYRENFLKKFGNTYDKTYRGLCEYYGISKDEYIAFWESKRTDFNNSYLSERIDFDYLFILETKYDEWFSDDYESKDTFNVVSDMKITDREGTEKKVVDTYIAAKRNTAYTIRYYTIDSKLINYVGTDKFNDFLKTTKDVNIITFMESFGIDKDTYMSIYADNVLYPYNPDYLFSTEKSNTYFTVNVGLKK